MNVQTWATLWRHPMARLSTLLLCLLLPLSSAQAQNNYGFSFAIGGAVNTPLGITTDAAGNIYVADTGNNRIVKFRTRVDPIGNTHYDFLGKISGTSKDKSHFSNPSGVAVDYAGNIIVADTSNNRIEKFDTNGNFLWTSGTPGTGNGQFQIPYAVAVDSQANIYVADSGNNRIQILNASGNYVWQFGGKGSANNQLSKPLGVALDSSGNIYVVDNGNGAIKKFDSTGKWVWTASGLNPFGVVVDSANNVDVSDTGNDRVAQYDSNGNLLRYFGSRGTSNGTFADPYGMAADSTGHIFVTDVDVNNRIQVFDNRGAYLQQFGSGGSVDGQFSDPTGVAVDNNTGDIYVTDAGNYRFQKFDSYGNFLGTIGSRGTGADGFIIAAGIAVDSSGDVYIADSYEGWVYQYTSQGDYLGYFAGGSSGALNNPSGVAVDSSDTLYVADTGNNRIMVDLDQAGKWTTFGSPGKGNGQFEHPSGVAVDSLFNIYVADSGNNRIQKFNSNFKFLWKVGTDGTIPGDFGNPLGLAVDGSGNVYVADTGNNRIQKFDKNGKYLTEFSLDAWGDTYASSVSSVAVGNDGTVYATDITNNRVVVFEALSSAAPTLTSLSQYQAAIGSPSFTLTIYGTNFGTASVVNFGKTTIKPTVDSTTQLTVSIQSSLLTSAKTVSVTVTNSGGGGTSNALIFSIVNPTPTLSSITRDQAAAGSGDTTIKLTGTGFVKGTNTVTGSTVLFGSTVLTTKYVSAKMLTATIPMAQLTTPEVVNVSVTNPAPYGPDGGVSNTLTFVVGGTNPVPSVSSLTPDQAVAGSAATTLTVSGANFVNGATILFNGTPLTNLAFISDTQLTATISTSQLATAGEFSVSVTNPAPGGGSSDSLTFTVANPTPILTGVSPAEAAAGAGATTVTLTGSGFTAQSTAQFNGASLSTTYVSATQLTASIPASQLTVPGNYFITVNNAAPGGGTSASFTFSVLNGVPTLISLTPNSSPKGKKVNLTITGTNFVPGAKVSFGVSQLTNVMVSPDGTTLTATITPTQTKKAGVYNVIVTNPGPGGGDSNSLPFTVN